MGCGAHGFEHSRLDFQRKGGILKWQPRRNQRRKAPRVRRAQRAAEAGTKPLADLIAAARIRFVAAALKLTWDVSKPLSKTCKLQHSGLRLCWSPILAARIQSLRW